VKAQSFYGACFFVLKTHTRVCVFAKSITIKAFKIKFTKKDGFFNPSFYFINLVLQFVSTIKLFIITLLLPSQLVRANL